MVHRLSPAKLALKRERALLRGFIRPTPKGYRHVLAREDVADRLPAMGLGLAATADMERSTGFHRRSASLLAQAVHPLVGEEAVSQFRAAANKADAAKHRTFLPRVSVARPKNTVMQDGVPWNDDNDPWIVFTRSDASFNADAATFVPVPSSTDTNSSHEHHTAASHATETVRLKGQIEALQWSLWCIGYLISSHLVALYAAPSGAGVWDGWSAGDGSANVASSFDPKSTDVASGCEPLPSDAAAGCEPPLTGKVDAPARQTVRLPPPDQTELDILVTNLRSALGPTPQVIRMIILSMLRVSVLARLSDCHLQTKPS